MKNPIQLLSTSAAILTGILVTLLLTQPSAPQAQADMTTFDNSGSLTTALLSDGNEGLFVMNPNGLLACYLLKGKKLTMLGVIDVAKLVEKPQNK